MQIVRAGVEHTDEVALLFDLYRQFYSCRADPELARRFIGERLANSESVVFLGLAGEQPRGFVQLYPSFCSVDAIRILILYDLYVVASARRRGLGEALMRRATEYARETDVSRLDLLTARDNVPGQSLYEKLGYRRTNQDFYAYSLDIQSPASTF